MSIQEARAIVSLISTVVISALYSAYMVQRYPDASSYSADIFRFWGSFVLILIPVSIVAKIVIHILFSVVNAIATREDEPLITDERDRLIDLKATRNALYVFSAGFLLAMGSLALDLPPAVMFMILIGAGVAADIVADISQFLFYRRGF
jgi:hypothetical protein